MATTKKTEPDITIFHIAHRGMRRDSQRFASLVSTLGTSADGRRRAESARRWLDGFRAELHEHHTVEDTVFYPALVERIPTVATPLQRVDAEHRALDVLLDELDASLRAIASDDGAATGAAADAARAADELAALISRHLDLEDADLVPLFVRHFTAAEYDALHSKALKTGRLRDLMFAVPWLLDHATDEERVQLFAEAPLPLRVLWHATHRRYARLVNAAFGDLPVNPVPAGAGANHS